jgi:Flp pilus assembly protein TadG
VRARLRRLLADRRRNERGYATTMVAALLASGAFMGLAAVAVDTGRWYVEVQRVQKAADAAALAGVPYLPFDLPNAIDRAKEVAVRNGYDDASPDVVVTVTRGVLTSQLRVTIESRIDNVFGRSIGVANASIVQSAVADFQAAAPMGSPCNTFGNEPDAGAGVDSADPTGTSRGSSPMANCPRRPQLWATIEGPQTDKSQGDRYQTRACASNSTHRCATSRSPANTEYQALGYFFVVRVQQNAVGKPVSLQLYDPAFVSTGSSCAGLFASDATGLVDDMNPFVTSDGKKRYSSASKTSTSTSTAEFCNGDYFPGGSGTALTTTFLLREQNDAADPSRGAAVAGCARQYTGRSTAPTVNSLKSGSGSYNKHLAKVFHNWTELCTFTPARAGDYYLQVRSNVAAAGDPESSNTDGNAAMIFTGSHTAAAATGNTTTGYGNNSFAIRAVTLAGYEKDVAVSGYERMPMFANAAASSSQFNLIRVLPGSAGNYIQFSFYDVADAGDAVGTVQVQLPSDAKDATTGNPLSVPFPGGCSNVGGAAMSASEKASCTAPVSNANNNGKLETITIPIPTTYTCDEADLSGCWYRVTVSFPTATAVADITTWDATVDGDPVRLVE